MRDGTMSRKLFINKISSMPQRLRAVIDAQGKMTDY